MSTQTVIQGDCLEVMKTFPDKRFDLVLTDPPYGLRDNNMRNAAAFMDMSWDVKVEDSLIQTAISKGKNAVVFGGNYYSMPPCRGFIVWDKGNTMYGRSWAECEMAWTSFDEVARIFKLSPTNKYGKQHPTEKPLELIRWIIENYSKEGDSILDPFMGSGTTLVAAKQLGRSATGIEISEKYCEIARSRLSQDSLF